MNVPSLNSEYYIRNGKRVECIFCCKILKLIKNIENSHNIILKNCIRCDHSTKQKKIGITPLFKIFQRVGIGAMLTTLYLLFNSVTNNAFKLTKLKHLTSVSTSRNLHSTKLLACL